MGRFVVAYWDDNIFEAPNAWYDQKEFRRCMVDILNAADMFAVANPRLGKILNQYSLSPKPTVTLKVPAIGLSEAPPALSPNTVTPIIGYAGNADHKRKVEEIVVPALVQLKREGTQFRFQVFGPELDVSSELDTLLEYHRRMNFEMWLNTRSTLEWTVALAPLPDSSFHNCKFHNKFLDYTALGAPGIYSNVPPYADVIEHRRTGMLVDNSPSAWACAIENLLADASLRERIVQESWQFVTQENSMAAVSESYKCELKPAFEFRHPPILGDKRALFNVTRWYATSIVRRIVRLIKGRP
jgi:glycosyltransferase involved in cell wall biosynthesis